MRYKVPCWNCDGEGNIEPIDEWDGDRCGHCAGKGFLVVTELTYDNCEDAIPIRDDVGEARTPQVKSAEPPNPSTKSAIPKSVS